MAIKELPVFPQTTYSETQGLVGIRQWQLDHGDNIEKFCDFVCKSHWPSYPDAIPIQVQSGAYNNDTVIKCAGECTKETMGPLPEYGAYKVVAHYALHRMTNCWPTNIPKPNHPPGTTLSLKIHGSGQVLMVTPSGMKTMLTPGAACNPNTPVENQSAMFFSRILVPITEFHVTCGRMTLKQVNSVLAKDWDEFQGCVNKEVSTNHAAWFLGAPDGTLLFDGYEISEGFGCDVKDPLRFGMTACLKQRVIIDKDGKPRQDIDGKYVGWNYDFVANNRYKNSYGWTLINLNDEGKCVPRYQSVAFKTMFGKQTHAGCSECPTTKTPLKDSDLCGKFDACTKDESALNQSVPSEASSSSDWRG